MSSNTLRGHWLLGRIVEVYQGEWSCRSRESPSGKEPADQTYFEIVSVGIAVK